jgi:glycosyltransferase involved in cell wall biosynthesis
MTKKIALIGTEIKATLNFRGTLIEHLVKDGHAVYVFATNYDDASRAAVNALGAVPINNPLNRSGLNPVKDIMGCYALYRVLKGLRPTAVLSYFVKPVVFGSIAARLAGVPKILGMLEGLGFYFTNRPESNTAKIKLVRRIQVLLYKISFRCLDTLILLNADDARDLLMTQRLKVRSYKILGGIGVDLAKFQPTKSVMNPVTFLFVGRLLFDKGIREFLAAAYDVKAAYPQVQFKIIGDCDGQNPASLTTQDRDRIKAEGVVDVLGFTDNVSDHLAASSVFVLPSYREGLSLAVQEAMAMGRPIITTTAPGCQGSIDDGVSGFYVPPFDAATLTEKMLQFCKHPKLIETMGKAAHKKAILCYDRKHKDQVLMDLLIKN